MQMKSSAASPGASSRLQADVGQNVSLDRCGVVLTKRNTCKSRSCYPHYATASTVVASRKSMAVSDLIIRGKRLICSGY